MSDAPKAVAATREGAAPAACRECAKPPAAGHTRCQRHLDLHRRRTRRKRSRERKQAFPAEQRSRLLELIANGIPLPQACETVGVAMSRVHALGRLDAQWAEHLDEALTAGRDPEITHGTSYAYKELRCRCPECRRAKYIERGPRRRPDTARSVPAPRLPDAGSHKATRPHRMTARDLDGLERLWRDGTPVDDIAEALGISQSSVYSNVKKLGLPARERPAQNRGAGGLGAEGDRMLTEMWTAGVPTTEIAQKLGMHPVTVRTHASRLDLPSSKERAKNRPRLAEEDEERVRRAGAARRRLAKIVALLEAGATIKAALNQLNLNPNCLATLRRTVPEAERQIREAYQAGAAVRAAHRPKLAATGARDGEEELRAAQLVVAAVASGQSLSAACRAAGATGSWVNARYHRHEAFRQALCAAAALHPGLDLHGWLKEHGRGGPVSKPRPPG